MRLARDLGAALPAEMLEGALAWAEGVCAREEVASERLSKQTALVRAADRAARARDGLCGALRAARKLHELIGDNMTDETEEPHEGGSPELTLFSEGNAHGLTAAPLEAVERDMTDTENALKLLVRAALGERRRLVQGAAGGRRADARPARGRHLRAARPADRRAAPAGQVAADGRAGPRRDARLPAHVHAADQALQVGRAAPKPRISEQLTTMLAQLAGDKGLGESVYHLISFAGRARRAPPAPPSSASRRWCPSSWARWRSSS